MQVVVAAGLLLVSLGVTVAPESGPNVDAQATFVADTSVDLHQLCEQLARRCWDLDPADFGMLPVDSALPSADGLGMDAEWAAGVELGMSLLGRYVGVKASANGSGEADHTGDADAPNQVPCADPLCPDLLVDTVSMQSGMRWDTRTFTESHCAVVEGAVEPGERRLLRFPYTTPNVGGGDLAIGDPDNHPEWFEWGNCHEHWHFREYADYRLWDIVGYAAWQTVRAAHPGIPPGELLAAFPEVAEHYQAGHKQGFCVIDIRVYSSSLAAPQQFTDCADNQGISVQWADEYHAFLDGQWIDVTDLAAGTYVLEAEVNPERFFAESNYANNAASIVIEIT